MDSTDKLILHFNKSSYLKSFSIFFVLFISQISLLAALTPTPPFSFLGSTVLGHELIICLKLLLYAGLFLCGIMVVHSFLKLFEKNSTVVLDKRGMSIKQRCFIPWNSIRALDVYAVSPTNTTIKVTVDNQTYVEYVSKCPLRYLWKKLGRLNFVITLSNLNVERGVVLNFARDHMEKTGEARAQISHRLTVYYSKGIWSHIILLQSIIFFQIALGLYIYRYADPQFPQRWAFVGIMAVLLVRINSRLIFLMVNSLYALYLYCRHVPVLVLDEQGIWTRQYGFFAWHDIRAVESISVLGASGIGFWLRGSDVMKKKSSLLGRASFRWSQFLKMPQMCFVNLSIQYEEIIRFAHRFM